MERLRVEKIEIIHNEILKNYGPAIHLFEVKAGGNNNPEHVVIKKNSITEIYAGMGAIVVESTSCLIKDNELKKNLYDGIYVTSNSSMIQ